MSEGEEMGRKEGTPARPATTTVPPPGADEVAEWTGYRVDDIAGNSVAKVQGLFVDCESGSPAWLLVKLGRFGKTVPISMRECAAAAGRIWVPHEREVIKDAPALDPEIPLNREQEMQVLDYYGIPGTVGRGAEIASRPEGAETSRPWSGD
jgi:hypothetical protein